MLFRRNTLGLMLTTALVAPAFAVAPTAKKLPIHGLTAMGSVHLTDPTGSPVNDMAELNAHPGVYKGAVINVRWRQIEPSRGVFDFSSIDAGLRALAKYNAAHPSTPAVGKLRIFSGINVPVWLMTLTGGPLNVGGKNAASEIAPYWSDSYRKEWRALQAAAATRYDADPLVGEIAASSCVRRDG